MVQTCNQVNDCSMLISASSVNICSYSGPETAIIIKNYNHVGVSFVNLIAPADNLATSHKDLIE